MYKFKTFLNLTGCFFLFLTFESSSQTTLYPKGAYGTITDLQKKEPPISCNCKIENRRLIELEKRGGNDFNLISTSEISGKTKKETKFYAFSDGLTLYLNGKQIGLQPGYINVIHEGRYLLFQSATPKQKGQTQVALGGAGNTGGAIGGQGVSMITHNNLESLRKKIYYTLDTTNGKVKILDKFNLTAMLDSFPKLKDQFVREPDNGKMETIIDYFKMMNSK